MSVRQTIACDACDATLAEGEGLHLERRGSVVPGLRSEAGSGPWDFCSFECMAWWVRRETPPASPPWGPPDAPDLIQQPPPGPTRDLVEACKRDPEPDPLQSLYRTHGQPVPSEPTVEPVDDEPLRRRP